MLEFNHKRMCSQCFAVLAPGASVCPACGADDARPPAPEPGALPPGSILHGQYVLGRTLGKGGFSITYTAYDCRRDRVVAVKEFFPETIVCRGRDGRQVQITPGQDSDLFDSGVRHFHQEAHVLSTLQHPNIIHVYNLYTENGTVYYTMEYLRGCDLCRYTERKGGRLSEREFLPILSGVAEALQTVHAKGMLHRDVAPDNIFITDSGGVKLIDFGAARNLVVNASQSFSVILKQGFAPMEQYQRRGNQGPWTDIYALGATSYFCLNGKMPLPSVDRINVPEISIRCSPALERIIRKMMAVKIEQRYQTIAAVKRDLYPVVRAVQPKPVMRSSEEIKTQGGDLSRSERPVPSKPLPVSVPAPQLERLRSRLYAWLDKLQKIPIYALVMGGVILLLCIIILILILNM